MSRASRRATSPKPPRNMSRGIKGVDVLEAAGRIMPEIMGLVFEGFRGTSEHVRAALPATITESEAQAVDAAAALCFGATIRSLWGVCGGVACTADPTYAGKFLRVVVLNALMQAAGHTGEFQQEAACQIKDRPN